MNWPALLADPPPQFALRYRTGAKKRPEGETLLVVHAGDHATLDRWSDEGHHARKSSLGHGESREVFALLARTGFPDVVAQTVPPGPGLLALELTGGPEDMPVLLHRSFVQDLPAWSALVARLDALCKRLGDA